jgi:hypothetical protein
MRALPIGFLVLLPLAGCPTTILKGDGGAASTSSGITTSSTNSSSATTGGQGAGGAGAAAATSSSSTSSSSTSASSGGAGGQPAPDAGDDAGHVDAGDAGVDDASPPDDAGDGGLACVEVPGHTALCDGVCTDLRSDVHHCYSCDNDCGGPDHQPNWHCNDGNCQWYCDQDAGAFFCLNDPNECCHPGTACTAQGCVPWP